MADSQRPEPGAPLPRLWKAPAEEEARPKRQEKDKAKPRRKAGVPEPTPEYDTIETRRKARLLIGIGGTALLGLLGFLLIKSIAGSGHKPAEEDPLPVIAAPDPTAKAMEAEAGLMLEQAKQLAKGKDPAATVAMLERLPASYPNTPAAARAREALDRHGKGEPFFPDPAATAAKAKAAASPSDGATPSEFGAATPKPTKPAEVAAADPGSASPTKPEPPKVVAKPLPVGFIATPGAQLDPSGWPLEITCQRDGSRMIFIPGGSFTMGDDGAPEEAPAHRVELSSYYIDQHEVTRKQYDAYAAASGGKVKSPHPESSADGAEALRPATSVNFRDASAFATWAGKMLPTEAQWEFAARGPQSLYYIAGEPPKWEKPRAPKQIDDVMSFAADRSALGVFDLSGNAWEWTRDAYDPRYYESIKGGAARDPQGAEAPRTNARYLVKGGSEGWHLSWREPFRPDRKLPHLGFRCVLNLSPVATAPGSTPKNSDPQQGTLPTVVPF